MSSQQFSQLPRWIRELNRLRRRADSVGFRREGAGASAFVSECLTTCDALVQEIHSAEVECTRLRGRVTEEQDSWQSLFDVMPVACLVTDAQGVILAANRASALLLNVSSKGLQSRTLTHFAIDREELRDLFARQPGNRFVARVTFRIRPRERSLALVEAIVVINVSSHGNGSAWLWFLMPVTAARQTAEQLLADEASAPVA